MIMKYDKIVVVMLFPKLNIRYMMLNTIALLMKKVMLTQLTAQYIFPIFFPRF